MDSIAEELNLYRTVVSMTGDVLYKYDILNDTMELFFGRADMSRYGSVVRGYTKMLSEQAASRQNEGVEAEEFIGNLSGDDKGFFECEAKLNNYLGIIKWYKVMGKTLYDDNNMPQYIVGRMTDIDSVKNEARQSGYQENLYDRLTGLLNKSGIKAKLKEKCAELNGAEGAFLHFSIDRFTDICAEQDKSFGENIIINMAQLLKSVFPYDAHIGRYKKSEFCVIFYGNDADKRFMSRLEELRNQISQMNFNGIEENGISISGGVYIGPFKPGEEYEIREKTGIALSYSRHHGNGSTITYSNELDEMYQGFNEHMSNDEEINNVKFDHQLVENALEILSERGEVEEAINLIFRNIGIKYNLDRIVLQELDSSDRSVKNTYNWVNKNNQYLKGIIAREKQPDYDMLYQLFEEEDIVIVSDTHNCEALRDYNMSSDLKSFVRCKFGNYNTRGCISFECYMRKHEWSDSEIKTFKLITKLVSTCLLTVRSYEEMLRINESYETHDALTGYHKYDVFLKEAQEYIEKHSNEGSTYAVMCTGMKDFMQVNARYGYDVGDKILKGYADTIRSGEGRFIIGARMNADNFVVLVHMFDSRGNQVSLASVGDMSERFIKEYSVLCPEINLETRAGLAIVRNGNVPLQEYVDRAFRLRTMAKEQGQLIMMEQ